jgi:hypothetical protein
MNSGRIAVAAGKQADQKVVEQVAVAREAQVREHERRQPGAATSTSAVVKLAMTSELKIICQ